jgi:hypothetical protein
VYDFPVFTTGTEVRTFTRCEGTSTETSLLGSMASRASAMYLAVEPEKAGSTRITYCSSADFWAIASGITPKVRTGRKPDLM